MKRLRVKFDFEWMNFQYGDRSDLNDAAGYEESYEYQQEHTEA
jgi:hypothetical protein